MFEVKQSEDMALMLEVANVHKTYRTQTKSLEILRGVDLRVANGEFIALQGASGTGKSTLLNVCGGLDEPDRGSVRIAGVEITSMSRDQVAAFRRARVGFIFQAFHLLPELTALENVSLPGKLAGRSGSYLTERAGMLLGRVGLGERRDHRPSQLSGGEQQRVGLARALMNAPALILADEPTGNLDSRTGGEIMDLLMELRRESGTTLVIATHDSAVAMRAERVVRIVDGCVAN